MAESMVRYEWCGCEEFCQAFVDTRVADPVSSNPALARAHEKHDPEAFRAKLRYWRTNGFPAVRYEHGGTGGKRLFHESTVRTEQARIIAEAAANGIEAVPAGSAG